MNPLVLIASVFCVLFLLTLVIGFNGMKKAHHSKVKPKNF